MPSVIIDRDDICLYVTEKCNSNCVMCPMSMDSRRRGNEMPPEEWSRLEKLDLSGASHMSVTGGEPLLCYAKLFPALKMITQRYPHLEILILTNGRILAIPEIKDEFASLVTDRYCVAIPIHGPDEVLHDKITMAPGSFRQSITALKKLHTTKAKIEVRIVGHSLNLEQINEIFYMLCSPDLRIDVINLVAMEMTGCAARNRNLLWVDYDILCRKAEEGIRYAMLHGIDIGLYNFPLCQVPEKLWPLVRHSITPSKVRYSQLCSDCSQIEACGGLFYSTCLLNLCAVKPFYGEGE